MAVDAIPVEKVPYKLLSNGVKMPGIGLGTFGSDHAGAQLIADTVREALRLGYRYIDCASCYGNEKEIGEVIREALDEGLPREELFIVGKLWNDKHAPADAIASCKQSIADIWTPIWCTGPSRTTTRRAATAIRATRNPGPTSSRSL